LTRLKCRWDPLRLVDTFWGGPLEIARQGLPSFLSSNMGPPVP
jgi:hypothetical protein